MSDTPDIFTRYAPMLARKINAINLRYLRELGIESFPIKPSPFSEWHDEVTKTVLEYLAHMEKTVEYYRGLAMEAVNTRPGRIVANPGATQPGWRAVFEQLPADQQQWLNGEWEIGETLP